MATKQERTEQPERTSAHGGRVRPAPAPVEASFTGLLALQRAAGNEVVNRILGSEHGAPQAELAGLLPLKLATQQRVQPALKVGAAHDPFEAEADRIADTVMKMSDSQARVRDAADLAPADGLETPDVLPMRIRRTAEVPAEAAFELSGSTETGVKRVLDSGGSPLPTSERSFFERRMGYDLGAVRVHHDPAAAQASQAINAKAFTVGRDIAFGDGAYKPGTQDGRRLMAHELTHVVQQGGVGVRAKRRQPDEDR